MAVLVTLIADRNRNEQSNQWKDNPPQTRAEAAGALHRLCQGQPETQRAVADAGALSKLVAVGAKDSYSVLRSHSSTAVQIRSLVTVGAVLSYSLPLSQTVSSVQSRSDTPEGGSRSYSPSTQVETGRQSRSVVGFGAAYSN